jgi:hypothetical protein
MASPTHQLPSTLKEVVAAAAASFENPATHSVNIDADWGPVHVFPDGKVFTGHLIDGVLVDEFWNGTQIISVLTN